MKLSILGLALASLALQWQIWQVRKERRQLLDLIRQLRRELLNHEAAHVLAHRFEAQHRV
jgi:hypothetical protein